MTTEPRKPPHRCAWCRSKLTLTAPLAIEGGQWACKETCRALEEDRIRRGETYSRAMRRRAAHNAQLAPHHRD